MRSCRLLLAAFYFSLAVSSAFGQVVITEIMYHPGSEDNGDEFIEIYNPGPTAVDLSNWCFDGVALCFDLGDSIPADTYLVVAPAGAASSTRTASIPTANGMR
jgi:hypothetical protein